MAHPRPSIDSLTPPPPPRNRLSTVFKHDKVASAGRKLLEHKAQSIISMQRVAKYEPVYENLVMKCLNQFIVHLPSECIENFKLC